MDFYIFTWNLYKFTKSSSKNYASSVSQKIIEAFSTDLEPNKPFIGTLLEIKANSKIEATSIMDSILNGLRNWRQSIKGGVLYLGGIDGTREWIIYLYQDQGMKELKVEILEVQEFIADAISSSNEEGIYNFYKKAQKKKGSINRQAMSKEKNKVLSIREKQLSDIEPHERQTLDRYERIEKKLNTESKNQKTFKDKLAKIEYSFEHYLNSFNNCLNLDRINGAEMTEKSLSEHQFPKSILEIETSIAESFLERDFKDVYSENFISIVKNELLFEIQNPEWYRQGIMIRADFGDGSRINIASAHLPGPGYTNKNGMIANSYLMAASVKGADIFIGDFNVYGNIDDFFFVDETGDIKQTTVRSENYTKNPRPLDRILRSQYSQWKVSDQKAFSPDIKIVINRNSPQKFETVDISDHYLLKATVTSAII